MITITTGLLAIILLALTLQDAFEVMLLPRAVQRQVRLVRYYYRASWAAWRAIARRLPVGHKREHFLGIYGALSMVTLFAAWASSLIVGFGMLFWALRAETQTTLANQLYMSGVTFFTLGYGDMVPQSGFSRLLAVIEGGTGFGFIAVVIGYLPVLYQLFSCNCSPPFPQDQAATGIMGLPARALVMACSAVRPCRRTVAITEAAAA
jgi:hypothetical protein